MSAAAAHHSMDLWGPRRAVSLQAARFRTGLVHILRLLFVIATMVSAGFLIGPVIQHNLRQAPPPAAPGSTAVTMLGPRFTGRDANDRPFVITAETARRRREAPSLIDLKAPRMLDDAGSTVIARDGVYDETQQVMDLVGDVVMTDASGYTFKSEQARMFVRENRIEGATQLHGTGPLGEIKADNYQVLDDGKRIVLKGRTWTKIIPENRRRKPAGER